MNSHGSSNRLHIHIFVFPCNFLQIIQYLRWRRHRLLVDGEDNLHFIAQRVIFYHMILNWIRLILSYLKFKRNQRTKRLINPHVMLPFMRGFRYQYSTTIIGSCLTNKSLHDFIIRLTVQIVFEICHELFFGNLIQFTEHII